MSEAWLEQTSLFVPSPDYLESTITLNKRAWAVTLLERSKGRAKLGSVCHLQPGTVLEICGAGYNQRTVKVRSNGACYFVFRNDLNS